MMVLPPHNSEVRQRDDGMFDVITGDVTAGPFPSYGFAQVIAGGGVPDAKPAPAIRSFKVIRGLRIAST
ncbi:hypothetical protein ABIE79_003328 [Bradyrhizobium diazoefficiens]